MDAIETDLVSIWQHAPMEDVKSLINNPKKKKMKKIILIALLLAGTRLYAQDASKSKSPFGRKIEHSGYGALTTNYSKFNGDDALFVGAYGGWMINHKLMLGLAGQYLVTQHNGY